MPDVVPEGILNSFNSIIPSGLNIIIWYGLGIAIFILQKGAMTLGNISYNCDCYSVVVSCISFRNGCNYYCILFKLVFGIHGGSVVFTGNYANFILQHMQQMLN